MKQLNLYLFSLSLFLVLALLSVGTAWSTTDIMDVASHKATSVFTAVRGIIFIVGGFGLVTLAFFAIFGKLKWTWFASLAVGLAILAAAGAIIDYATTSDGGKVDGGLSDQGGFSDTLVGGGR